MCSTMASDRRSASSSSGVEVPDEQFIKVSVADLQGLEEMVRAINDNANKFGAQIARILGSRAKADSDKSGHDKVASPPVLPRRKLVSDLLAAAKNQRQSSSAAPAAKVKRAKMKGKSAKGKGKGRRTKAKAKGKGFLNAKGFKRKGFKRQGSKGMRCKGGAKARRTIKDKATGATKHRGTKPMHSPENIVVDRIMMAQQKLKQCFYVSSASSCV